jgi:putative nucleotidyltransferase with HDIG domain
VDARAWTDDHAQVGVSLPIRLKIIGPFFILVVLVGILGTWMATARLSIAVTSEFGAGLLRASLLANDQLEVQEADRLAQLRAATDTLGVPEAVATGNQAALARLLTPIAANAAPAAIELRVLDRRANQLFGVRSTGGGPVGLAAFAGGFGTEPAVQRALAGRTDAVGEREVFLWTGPGAPMLYWIGPVRVQSQTPVGAVVIGQALADVAAAIPGSSFYSLDGTTLGPSPLAAAPLSPSVREQVWPGHTVRVMATSGGHQAGTLFSDWTMRGRPLGYLGITLNADGLAALLAQLRLVLVAIFAGAGVLTLLIGALVAARITAPVEQLATATRLITAGNLQHRVRVTSKDEIGALARSFNQMAAGLAETRSQVQETSFSTIEALARAIDARDPYTFGHSARVAAFSLEIASAMGFDAEQRDALRRAALLHDIGKIGIEDRVLRKPDRLNDEEVSSMREHPRIGYEMLKGLRFLRPGLPGVLHHHERWDGSGYPNGLAGQQIPLLVRVLTVADVFDALTSERPYRRALDLDGAIRAMVPEAGVVFDPDVVTAFVSRRHAIAGLMATPDLARIA